jgi:hypothetical protein
VPVTKEMAACPKNKLVVYKICVKPPTKAVLAEMLETEAAAQEVELGMDMDHVPDRAWMIIALATLNPEHEIFSKSYQPAIAERGLASNQIFVSNADGFFTGQPRLTKLSDLKVKAASCFTKQEKLQIMMEKEKARIERASQRLDQIAEQVKQADEKKSSKRDLRNTVDSLMSNFERERSARMEMEQMMAQMQREMQSQQDYVRGAQEFYQGQSYQQFLS